MAFLLDDILLFPIKGPIAGIRWVMKQIQTMADEELLNDQPWKERLIELPMMLEVGYSAEAQRALPSADHYDALKARIQQLENHLNTGSTPSKPGERKGR